MIIEKDNPDWIFDYIDKAENVVVLLLKTDDFCETVREKEVFLQEALKQQKYKSDYYVHCYPINKIPFPVPYLNRVYFFAPKNRNPVVHVELNYVISNLDGFMDQAVAKMKNVPITEMLIERYPEKAKLTEEIVRKEEQEPKDDPTLELPSAYQMARNVLKQAWLSSKDVMAGRQFLANKDVVQKRVDICNSCEFLQKSQNRCTKCGCYMDKKVNLASAYCPLNKWE